jgi:hypothetical protein
LFAPLGGGALTHAKINRFQLETLFASKSGLTDPLTRCETMRRCIALTSLDLP